MSVELENLIVERSIDYYGKDRNHPAAREPGGNDFLSPCLVEADLMRRGYWRAAGLAMTQF